MAKAKKEFKSRVRKIKKHLDKLQDLVGETFDEQKEQLDVADVLNSMGDSVAYLENPFPKPPPPERTERKDPRGIAN